MTEIRIVSFTNSDDVSPYIYYSSYFWRHLITRNHPWLYGQLKHVEALFEVLV